MTTIRALRGDPGVGLRSTASVRSNTASISALLVRYFD
jgi:hypothetical protein